MDFLRDFHKQSLYLLIFSLLELKLITSTRTSKFTRWNDAQVCWKRWSRCSENIELRVTSCLVCWQIRFFAQYIFAFVFLFFWNKVLLDGVQTQSPWQSGVPVKIWRCKIVWLSSKKKKLHVISNPVGNWANCGFELSILKKLRHRWFHLAVEKRRQTCLQKKKEKLYCGDAVVTHLTSGTMNENIIPNTSIH